MTNDEFIKLAESNNAILSEEETERGRQNLINLFASVRSGMFGIYFDNSKPSILERLILGICYPLLWLCAITMVCSWGFWLVVCWLAILMSIFV